MERHDGRDEVSPGPGYEGELVVSTPGGRTRLKAHGRAAHRALADHGLGYLAHAPTSNVSPTDVARRTLTYCHRRFGRPSAAWASAWPSGEFSLVEALGFERGAEDRLSGDE